MRALTENDRNELNNGDEKFKPFVDMNTWLELNQADKNVFKNIKLEFERIYCKWRFIVFEGNAPYYSCKSIRDQTLIKKLIAFCTEHKLHPLTLLMFLYEKALKGQVNKEAFYLLNYATSDKIFTAFLESRIINSKKRVENSFADSAKNSDINFLIKESLSKKFDISSFNDRYIQTLIAVLKDMIAGRRVNCSQSIKDMCTHLITNQTIVNLVK